MASKAIGFLNFKFSADLSGFERAMKKAQKKLKKFGKSVAKTGKSLTMGLTLPIVALGVASIKAFDEQQKAIAQVEAGLKSTAGMVGFTSEELQKMSSDLQKKTIFGDEEILKNATAQLLTFTNITGTEFAKTQEIVLDLATRLDGDLKSSAIMLGKALNDPVANLSALSRAGIQFSKEQKATINSLVETNDLAGAQTIILAELEKQYGGSAEAAASAGLGGIQQLQNEIGDLSEQIGARLVPHVKSFVTWIKELAVKFDGLSESTKDNIVTFGLILAAIGPVLIIIGKMSIGISALIPVFSKLGTFLLANPYILLAAAIAGVAYVIYDLVTALNFQIDVQKELADLDTSAKKSIAGELVNIRLLTDAVKDENASLDDKLIALETLKKTYPGYYDEIDETTLSTQTLDAATETLTKNLMQVARLTAYKDKLTEIAGKMIDLEESSDIDLSTSMGVNLLTSSLGPLYQVLAGVTGANKELKKEIQENIDTKEYQELEILFENITGKTNTLQIEVDKTNASFKKLTHGTEELIDEVEDLGDGTDKLVEPIKAITLAVEDYGNQVMELSTAPSFDDLFPTGQVDEFAGALGILGEEMAMFFGTDIEEMEAGLMTIMENIGGELSQGADSFKEYGQVVKGVIRDVIGGLISQGITAALTNAMSSIPPFPGSVFLIPALAGAAAGLARTAFNSLIPKFAEGGLVTQPTLGLIGEGIGTSTSNPEVIAPLDKLKSMIGGGNQHITVTGKLIGNDIFLSNAKTGVDRLRTV